MLRITAIWINRILWTLLLGGLIAVAAYVSIGRYYVVYAESYQKELVERIVRSTGLPITVDKLSARWSKLSPIIDVERVTLDSPDDNEAPLTIDNISFQINPLLSLYHQQLHAQRLQIKGVNAFLKEVAPGQWQLRGHSVAAKKTEVGFERVIDILLLADGIELNKANLQLEYFEDKPSSEVQVNELYLVRDGDFRRLKSETIFKRDDKPFVAIVESIGDPRNLEKFTAKGYIKFDEVDLKEQLPAINSFGIDLTDARVDGELWLDWQPNREISVQGDIDIPILDVSAFSDESIEPLTDLSLSFRLAHTQITSWGLWLSNISTTWKGHDVSFENVHVDLDDKSAFNVYLPELDLKKLHQQIIGLDILGQDALKPLNVLSPQGHLKNVYAKFQRASVAAEKVSITEESKEKNSVQNVTPLFVLSANLDQVAVESWKGAPGVKGLDGYLELSPNHGLVEFNSSNLEMAFTPVYKHSLLFDSATGQVGWTIKDKHLSLKSGPLFLTGDHGPATGLLGLNIPLVKGASDFPKMSLMIGIRNTDALDRNKFIPYFLNKGFLDWMDKSVPQGLVKEGLFVYRGSLLKDGFADRTVQLAFDVENTELKYHPQWPKLTDISAKLVIDDGAVFVDATTAKMFDLDLVDTRVDVVPNKTGGSWLTVKTHAHGDASDGIRIVNESPINDLTGGVCNDWQLGGSLTTAINLKVPISIKTASPIVDVKVELADSDLIIDEYRMFINDLNGPLHYQTEQGMSSSGLQGLFYERPLNIVIHSKKMEGTSLASGENKNTPTAPIATFVDISGRVDMDDVAEWSRQAALSFFEGQADFSTRITIHPGSSSRLDITSNLKDATVHLPGSYGKSSGIDLPFHLSMPLGEPKYALNMSLAGLSALQINIANQEVSSMVVALGVDKNLNTFLAQQGSLTVTGDIGRLVLDDWKPVLEKYTKEEAIIKAQLSSNSGSGSINNGKAVDKGGLGFLIKDLHIARFDGFDQSFQDSVVNGQRQPDQWLIAVSNPMLSGQMIISDDPDKAIMIDLDRLRLPENTISKDGIGKQEPPRHKGLDIDLNIDQLLLGEDILGNLGFNLRTDHVGIIVDNIYGNIKGIKLDKSSANNLQWWRYEGNDYTRFKGVITFDDIGDLLDEWKYQRFIESKSGTTKIDLTWLGSPADLDLVSSEGALSININDGGFLQTSDTTQGTLKVVSIVNLANMLRRLKLDFTDLFESGVSYDEIAGNMIFEDGQLSIVDSLNITSPSSRFQLYGAADLTQQELDMQLIATLPVASNLPWIAALAGGLPVAAGVYVASKVFKKQVDKFSSAVYRIEGDWNKPQLQLSRVFDDGKKSIDVEKTKKIQKKHDEILQQESSKPIQVEKSQ